MPCNCGKGTPKVAMTSEAASAMLSGSQTPTYRTILPDGSTHEHELYVDAKTDAVRTGGKVTEVRG